MLRFHPVSLTSNLLLFPTESQRVSALSTVRAFRFHPAPIISCLARWNVSKKMFSAKGVASLSTVFTAHISSGLYLVFSSRFNISSPRIVFPRGLLRPPNTLPLYCHWLLQGHFHKQNIKVVIRLKIMFVDMLAECPNIYNYFVFLICDFLMCSCHYVTWLISKSLDKNQTATMLVFSMSIRAVFQRSLGSCVPGVVVFPDIPPHIFARKSPLRAKHAICCFTGRCDSRLAMASCDELHLCGDCQRQLPSNSQGEKTLLVNPTNTPAYGKTEGRTGGRKPRQCERPYFCGADSFPGVWVDPPIEIKTPSPC